ncbi:MAG: alpha/beta fold hydrolase [Alphaproteobacteria bacterium]|nr:alpha/beta fold hydrolase [Alphaproteobacteria bacterium]
MKNVLSTWLLGALSPNPSGRVFCFAHAGGSADSFMTWRERLPASIDLAAVQYPGRGRRIDDEPIQEIGEIIDHVTRALMPLTDVPFALFGHSLGALLAFETARRLVKIGRAPRLLVASACRSPSLLPSPKVVKAASLDGLHFINAIRAFGGIPAEIVNDHDVLDIVTPIIRSDFRLVANYRYRPGRRLPMPILVANGSSDQHTAPANLEGWALESTEEVEFRTFEGGHFYLDDDDNRDLIIDAIASELDELPSLRRMSMAGHS